MDNLVGTAGDDTFQGILGAGDGGTVNTFDKVDGGAGADTLNLLVKGNVGIPSNVTVQNIETINLVSNNGNVVRGEGVNAAVFGAAAQEIWQIDAATRIEGLADGQTAGYRNVKIAVEDGQPNVEAGFTGTVANIALDGVGAKDTLPTDDEGFSSSFGLLLQGDDVETLNISGSTADGANVIFDLSNGFGEGAEGESGLLALETINIDLSSDTAVLLRGGVLFTSVTEVDASASTGDLSMALVAPGSFEFAIETLNLGSGNDEVAISLDSLGVEELAVNLGAGADKIWLTGGSQAEDGNTALTITLGAGSDTVAVGGLSNVSFSVDDAVEGVVTIADFVANEDILDLSEQGITGFFETQNLVDAAILAVEADKGDLFDALEAIEDYATDTEAVNFGFDGNTYVYGGDMLIELTGTVDLAANNLVFAADTDIGAT